MLQFQSRQGATLTAVRLTNRMNRRQMASLSHGRNTMKTDSQNYKGRSSMLYANRIACIRTPNVDEDGAIVLGPMTEPRNHDGQDLACNKAIPFHRPNQGRITL